MYWCSVRWYIQHFLEIILAYYSISIFLARTKTSLPGMLTASGDHPCSVQVVLTKGYVILDIVLFAATKAVLQEIRKLSVSSCFTVIDSFIGFSQTREFDRWERVGRSEDLGFG